MTKEIGFVPVTIPEATALFLFAKVHPEPAGKFEQDNVKGSVDALPVDGTPVSAPTVPLPPAAVLTASVTPGTCVQQAPSAFAESINVTEPCLDASASDVAVTVTLSVAGAELGAI